MNLIDWGLEDFIIHEDLCFLYVEMKDFNKMQKKFIIIDNDELFTDLIEEQVSIIFEMPLSEIVMDFFDILKSKSQGYASVDFVFDRFQKADLVKVDVAINGLVVDSLSAIMHKSEAQRKGRDIAQRLRNVIPRQMFEIPIQIMLGSKIIARESVKAFRKNVTAKLYGGDVTRKKKLLEKQKAGKKKMKQFGKVSIPQDAFLNYFKSGE